jgi:hypothetical protein
VRRLIFDCAAVKRRPFQRRSGTRKPRQRATTSLMPGARDACKYRIIYRPARRYLAGALKAEISNLVVGTSCSVWSASWFFSIFFFAYVELIGVFWISSRKKHQCSPYQWIEVPNNLLLIGGWTRSWEHQFITALICQCASLCMEQETWTAAISSKMHAEWSAFLQIASATSWTGQHG